MSILWLLNIYLIFGLVFGIWFIFKGSQKLDAGMNDVSIWTRLILLPGSISLWPFLIIKLIKK